MRELGLATSASRRFYAVQAGEPYVLHKLRDGLLKHCRLEVDPTQDRSETRRVAHAGARLYASFLLMNAAATMIAGFGLLADSEAVIIGAMLIAMLYGPILGIGLACAELDEQLLARTATVELAGAVWVLLLGLALGWLCTARIPLEQLLGGAR